MKISSAWTRLGLVAVLALGLIVMGESNAWAICNPGRHGGYIGSKFAGSYRTSPFPVTTASAVINGYTPYVDFNNQGSVSAWPMIAKQGCKYGFVQIGEIELFHSYTESFYEAAECSTLYPPVEYAAAPFPSSHNYIVNMSGGSGAFAVFIDQTKVYSGRVTWSPGTEMQMYGETHALNDQMYGSINVPGVFSNVRFCQQLPSGYDCSDPIAAGTLNVAPPSYDYWYSIISGDTLQIGDLACVY